MPPTDPLIGVVLDGKYAVDRLLGIGGMGAVYAGTHVGLSRLVAIKVLRADMTLNQSFVARFEREARTTARLEHPNAVQIHDFGTLADGSRYLVMEYIDGRTLREVLRANGSLSVGVAADLICQAAGAVDAAHANGIIHRDLKPENLMVRRDSDDRLFLKVVDFGLAKVLANNETLLTNASEIMGTPRYMAPEQFQGLPVDGRADVYALGCVLFELLTGRTPYDGTILEIVGQHVHAPIPSPFDHDVDVPPAIDTLIRRALSKDPDTRPASADAFAQALEAAAVGLSTSCQSLVLPVQVLKLEDESVGDSNVTTIPDSSGAIVLDLTDATNDTIATTYGTNAIGSAIPTVAVAIRQRPIPRWQLPIALGFAGIVIVSGFMFQGRLLSNDEVPVQAPVQVQAPGATDSDERPPVAEPLADASTVPARPSTRRGDNTQPAPQVARPPTVAPEEDVAGTSPAPPAANPEKKDNRGVLPTVGGKAKSAVVSTGRGIKKIGGALRRAVPGQKPKKPPG